MAENPTALTQAHEALVVALAKTGDRQAFTELVRRRQSWVRNFMRRCCGDPTLADDLSQQTFLQAWKDIGRLKNPRTFQGWFKRLALNVWLQHERRNDLLDDAAIDVEASPAAPASHILATDLDRALTRLSGDVRVCLVLNYHEGYTHQEIAEALEMPLGTVKSHISRGGKRLQELLMAYDHKPHATAEERTI